MISFEVHGNFLDNSKNPKEANKYSADDLYKSPENPRLRTPRVC